MKRSWIIVLVALTAVLVMGAIGTAQQPVKLTIAIQTLGDVHGDLEVALVEKYMKAHPEVQIETIAANNGSGLEVQFAAGLIPDVIGTQTGTTSYINLAIDGHFYDIHALANRYGYIPGFSLDQLHPSFIEMHRLNGEEHLIPYRPFIYGMYANLDLFSQSGVARPQDDWTWTDYAADLKKISRDTTGDSEPDVWGGGTDPIWSRISPWVWQNGGDWFTEDEQTTLIDQPEVYEAIDWLGQLRQLGIHPPWGTNPQSLFSDGRIGVYGPIGNLHVGNLRSENVPFAWDVVALPSNVTRATLAGTRGYVIPKETDHPKEAWELAQYLSSWEAQKFRFEELGMVGTHLRLATLDEIRKPSLPPANIRMFFDAMAYAKPGPNHPQARQALSRIVKAYEAVWKGERDAKSIGDELAPSINELLRAESD